MDYIFSAVYGGGGGTPGVAHTEVPAESGGHALVDIDAAHCAAGFSNSTAQTAAESGIPTTATQLAMPLQLYTSTASIVVEYTVTSTIAAVTPPVVDAAGIVSARVTG